MGETTSFEEFFERAAGFRPFPYQRRLAECDVWPARVEVPTGLAEQVRRNLMGSLKRVLGDSELTVAFTGKSANGRPAVGHPQVSILPLDEDGDGLIDALLVSSPQPLSLQEQRAIDRLHPVRRRKGHSLVLTPVRYGLRSELLSPAAHLVSHTSFAPTQHWLLKRDGDESAWLEKQVRLECARRGLPEVVRVERVAAPSTGNRRLRWLDFRRARKDHAPQPAYGLRLELASPVLAPLSLGYASHFGLGCFLGVARG